VARTGLVIIRCVDSGSSSLFMAGAKPRRRRGFILSSDSANTSLVRLSSPWRGS